MAGTWVVNLIFGISAFLFTYFFSIINNTWKTSASRGVIGFILFFVLGYFLRFVLNPKALGATPAPSNKIEVNSDTERLNMTNELEQVEDTPFQAISLQSLHRVVDSKDPKIIADTIRTIASQNQEG